MAFKTAMEQEQMPTPVPGVAAVAAQQSPVTTTAGTMITGRLASMTATSAMPPRAEPDVEDRFKALMDTDLNHEIRLNDLTKRVKTLESVPAEQGVQPIVVAMIRSIWTALTAAAAVAATAAGTGSSREVVLGSAAAAFLAVIGGRGVVEGMVDQKASDAAKVGGSNPPPPAPPTHDY